MIIFKPEVFQGNLRSKAYFEGWYFKNVSEGAGEIWSFIPGISLNRSDPHAFIQAINGMTGFTKYLEYPLSKFSASKKKLLVRIGDSVFTNEFMDLNIAQDDFRVRGKIHFINPTPFAGNLFAPGIMGWYSYVPLMECRHGLVSMNHGLKGNLAVNDKIINFSNGKGYIEKDWGRSFPSCWIWTQANNFHEPEASVMFSVAKIPWFGKFFMGFICFVYLKGHTWLFTTWNGSILEKVVRGKESLEILLKNKNHALKLTAHTSYSGNLKAPRHGVMDRYIKESVNAHTEVSLKDSNGNILFSGSSPASGLEIVGEIIDLLIY